MKSSSLVGTALKDSQITSKSRNCRKHCAKGRLEVKAAGSTYGTNFRVTTFGESHGKAVGCVIDGVPPRLPITQEEIQVLADTIVIILFGDSRCCLQAFKTK